MNFYASLTLYHHQDLLKAKWRSLKENGKCLPQFLKQLLYLRFSTSDALRSQKQRHSKIRTKRVLRVPVQVRPASGAKHASLCWQSKRLSRSNHSQRIKQKSSICQSECLTFTPSFTNAIVAKIRTQSEGRKTSPVTLLLISNTRINKACHRLDPSGMAMKYKLVTAIFNPLPQGDK